MVEFRAKSKGGIWRYGYYVAHQKVTPYPIGSSDLKDNDEYFLLFDGFSDWGLPRELYKCEIDRSTLGQFVNLVDSNVKRVYVGDILQDETKRKFVVFEAEGGFAVCTLDEWEETKHKPILYSGLSEPQNAAWTKQSCKIIGNIYDGVKDED